MSATSPRLRLTLVLAMFAAVPAGAIVAAAQPSSSPHPSYRLSGDARLIPVAVSDDGQRTYIQWRPDQPMPATFALGPTGGEQMVEGYVRGGVFTIDRVYGELIFRIDRISARAKRIAGHDD